MTTKTAVQYVKLASAKTTGGHSYWREIPSDAILVADASIRNGGDPTSTDDGRLEVDATAVRDQGLTGAVESGYLGFLIPLTNGTRTVATMREAEWLASYFGVPLRMKADGAVYRLVNEAHTDK